QRAPTHEGDRGGERPAQADVRRALARPRGAEGGRPGKSLSPDEKRAVVSEMHREHGVSVRRGCEAVGLPRSTYRYERRPKADEPVVAALSALVDAHP